MTLCSRRLDRIAPHALLLCVLAGCAAPAAPPAGADEDDTLSRTEFTDRVENFFEYTPLQAGAPSAFLIHLTDLDDGTPVARAEVELSVRPTGRGGETLATTAQVGRVTGIYVAELAIPSAGTYDIEFRIRNDRLDERMLLGGFEVEAQR